MITDLVGKSGASIHLDYGADWASFNFEDLYIGTRGLRMKTRWSFATGAELSVNFQVADAEHKMRILRTQGVVVGCERHDDGAYCVTMLFVEETPDLQELLNDLAVEGAHIEV